MASTAPEEPAAGTMPAAPVPSSPRLNPGWGLVILGGLLGVLGAFLTWATVDYGGVVTVTKRGVSAGRDGKITVVLAVLVLGITAAAFMGWVRAWMRSALAVLGIVIAFVAVADLVGSPSAGSQLEAKFHVTNITSSNGIGEWLTLVAGILVVVGVVLVGRYSRPVTEAPVSPVTETPASPVSETPASPVSETPASQVTETPASRVTDPPGDSQSPRPDL